VNKWESSNGINYFKQHPPKEARFHDGHFKTPRPKCLDVDVCKEIENYVRNLIKLLKEDKVDELALKHAMNQEEL